MNEVHIYKNQTYDETSCLEKIKLITADYFTKCVNISTIYNEY